MVKNFKEKSGKSGLNQIIYGLHSVKAALLNEKRDHFELIVNENQRNFAERYKNKIKKITVLDNKDFKLKFGAENKSQGLILKTIEKSKITLNEFLEVEKNETLSTIVVLDQITDPQNIGSIMRSCAMFNCKAIIVAKDNSQKLHPHFSKLHLVQLRL